MTYSCEECDLVFTRSWNYKRHMAIKHPEDQTSEEEEHESSEEESTESGSDTEGEEADQPNIWKAAIEETISRLQGDDDEYTVPEAVLKEPFPSEFVLELQKTVTQWVDYADAFKEDPTYNVIMKQYKKISKEAKGYDDDEALQSAWMDRRFFVKKRLRENIDCFIDTEDSDEIEGMSVS